MKMELFSDITLRSLFISGTTGFWDEQSYSFSYGAWEICAKGTSDSFDSGTVLTRDLEGLADFIPCLSSKLESQIQNLDSH